MPTAPDGMVTSTVTTPAGLAGVVTVIVVLVLPSIVARSPSKVTESGPLKPVPVIVTVVPPSVVPSVGLRLSKVEAVAGVTVIVTPSCAAARLAPKTTITMAIIIAIASDARLTRISSAPCYEPVMVITISQLVLPVVIAVGMVI